MLFQTQYYNKRYWYITCVCRYLHHEVTPHIIHRDVKASNVLLDSNFEPLVADFGFAKLIPEGVSHMTTRVKGTLGYLAPEYAMWGKVSPSCDVYSFGILLLEIFTGRKPIEKLPGGVKRTITEWAEPLIAAGKLKDVVDPKLGGNFDEKQLKHVIHAAAMCVQSEAERRPKMKEVADILAGYYNEAINNGGGEIGESYTTKGMKNMRLSSIKYGDDLLALDDEDIVSEGNSDCNSNASYGVFGAMPMQKMQYPYKHVTDSNGYPRR